MSCLDLKRLLTRLTSESRCEHLFQQLHIDPRLNTCGGLHEAGKRRYSRAMLAQALNMMLFEDLIKRVPEGGAYTDDEVKAGRQIFLDHGALRTVALSGLAIPPGHLAFARILEPLGYRQVGKYPLDALKMCGFVYCHEDFPDSISQFFVSELYPERFSAEFQTVVQRVLASTHDPLDAEARRLLEVLKQRGTLDLEEAAALLPTLLSCFARLHEPPQLADYRRLLEESKEMAWISTEGNAFNHATDRVDDIEATDRQQRELGRPMKPEIEVGKNANIRQTAYRATTVEREFKEGATTLVQPVPGSFFEFIQRGQVKDQVSGKTQLDLRFDSQNAQGIFHMTRAGGS
ncbi:MAG: DUF1338 family protein [Hahellaceae bacterium]|nr:DUF1338 family protein [Hahellaceae bacterium]